MYPFTYSLWPLCSSFSGSKDQQNNMSTQERQSTKTLGLRKHSRAFRACPGPWKIGKHLPAMA